MSLFNLKNGVIADGVATSTGSTQQFSSLPCDLVRFKVIAGNTVFVGDASPLFPVASGDDTGWIVTKNLNDWYHSTGDGGSSGTVYYMAAWS